MFFCKVIYLVCSRIFSPFLFPLPSCFSLALWPLASHSAAVRSFSLSLSPLLFSFVSFRPMSWLFSLSVPFALLLLPGYLALSLSLCRCPFLLSVPQLFAFFFCLSGSLSCLFLLLFASFSLFSVLFLFIPPSSPLPLHALRQSLSQPPYIQITAADM